MPAKNITVRTSAGDLELVRAMASELQSIGRSWPMGLVLNHLDTGPTGLVFQIGEREAYGIKFQPLDTDEQTAKMMYSKNLLLIASALPFYLRQNHQGTMLPCAYFKKKGEGRFESGQALFLRPHPASKREDRAPADAAFDEQLGEGASRMICPPGELRHPLQSEHPLWTCVVQAGLSQLTFAPMIPAAVPGPPNIPHSWLDRIKILSQQLS